MNIMSNTYIPSFSFKLKNIIVDFIISLSIFTLTVFFTPNFNIVSFPILILSSITISILEKLVHIIFKSDDIIAEKSVLEFTISFIIIYITKYIIEGYYISMLSTIIASLIYSISTSIISNLNYYN